MKYLTMQYAVARDVCARYLLSWCDGDKKRDRSDRHKSRGGRGKKRRDASRRKSARECIPRAREKKKEKGSDQIIIRPLASGREIRLSVSSRGELERVPN